MTCRELTEFLLEYEDGLLPGEARAAFEVHLSRCHNCVTYLESYRRTVRLARRAFEHDDAAVPDEVPEELVQAILSARQKRTCR